MGTRPRKPGAARPSIAVRCKNLYRFIRLRLGDGPSDREVARRWGMEWKSFVTLKQGKRQMPRFDELEALAEVLDVAPSFVFQVAGGLPANEVAALLSREHRWRALLERVTDAIFTVDAHGRLQEVNARFCALAGRDEKALAQLPLVDLATQESAPRVLAALARVAQDGEVHGVELALRGVRGGDRLLEMAAARITDLAGACIGAQFTARDVTEERRAVEELVSQRRELQALYDCVPAACIVFAADGQILAANPLVEGVCAFTASELVGRNAFDVFGNPGPAGCPVTRAFLTAQIEQQVSSMQNRGGLQVFVHRTAGPIVSGGKVEKVIEMMVDVTRQIQGGDLRVLSLCRDQSLGGAEPYRPERRLVLPRVATSFAAQFRHNDLAGGAIVTNLGSGGLFLQTPDGQPPVGEEIELEWALPGDQTPVRARGVVAWRRAPAKQRPGGFGVRFLSDAPVRAPIAKG